MSLDVATLETSFQAIAPRGAEFVDAFYRRLFAEHPETRVLFRQVTLADQKDKLLRALALTIENLRRPETLAPALRALGKRHGSYGVTAYHYPMVGLALLGTLAEFLGPAFTPRVRLAWADAFGAIMTSMLEGAVEGLHEEVLARPV